MVAKNAKQIVYRYDRVAESDEVEVDLDGDIRIPQKDEVLRRKEKGWRVVHVIEENAPDGRIPVFRVFLQGIRQ